jgi:transporter family protein
LELLSGQFNRFTIIIASMWALLALASALCLGVYDIFKKISLRDNNVVMVLLLNTVFGALLMSPVLISGIAQGNWGLGGTPTGHLMVLLKSAIVLSSWLLGYFGIKHLPLTIAGPVNASRPVMVLIGALVIFGERLNTLQWCGIAVGLLSLFLISRVGAKEGFPLRGSRWLWFSLGAAVMGAVSALYDKYLLERFEPLEVQAWYSLYQVFIMGGALIILTRIGVMKASAPFKWRWSIPCISLFLTVADIAYFYALSLPDSMIAIVSMIRRGSVLVSFFYGVFALKESHVKAKLVDLTLLAISLALLVMGSGAGR